MHVFLMGGRFLFTGYYFFEVDRLVITMDDAGTDLFRTFAGLELLIGKEFFLHADPARGAVFAFKAAAQAVMPVSTVAVTIAGKLIQYGRDLLGLLIRLHLRGMAEHLALAVVARHDRIHLRHLRRWRCVVGGYVRRRLELGIREHREHSEERDGQNAFHIQAVHPQIVAHKNHCFHFPSNQFRAITSIIFKALLYELMGENSENTEQGTPEILLAKSSVPAKTASHIKGWLRDLVFSVGIATFVILFLYQPVKVEGTSMLPCLEDQERIFINKFVYKWESIEQGDVIVFRYPRDLSKSYIKRVIAIGGDKVRIFEGQVYVNGKKLDEAYVPPQYADERSMAEYKVAANGFFVMGDHRSMSSDSRDFGSIDRSLVTGKAVFVYWPVQNAGVVR